VWAQEFNSAAINHLSEIPVDRPTHLIVAYLDLEENKRGDMLLKVRTQLKDKTQVQGLFEKVKATEFRPERVTTMFPDYYVVWLDGKGQVVAACRFNFDSFVVVNAYKENGKYYCGRTITAKSYRGLCDGFDRELSDFLGLKHFTLSTGQ